MTAAVQISHLSKTFRVWRNSRDMLIEALTGRQHHHEFQALRDITMDVPRGSVVGIMGRNGAGKSTLLRIVAGTLDATAGTVTVEGRISAILELGTGFHVDYTGRENIFLGGMCLGLSRAEITERLDEIISFSELQDFIDQPFRTYSTGMQARLTFAVATCVDPDLLIVDEALGVGDARFQLKSFDRIRSFKDRGKSILLVSHNIPSIMAICDRAILLEKGQVIADGDPNEVGKLYHEMLFAPERTAPSPLGSMLSDTRLQLDLIGGDHSKDGEGDRDLIATTAQVNLADEAESGVPVPAVGCRAGAELSNTDAAPKGTQSVPTLETGDDDASGIAPTRGRGQQFPDVLATAIPNTSADTGRERRYGLRRIEIVATRLVDFSGRSVKSVQSLGEYKLLSRIRAKDAMNDICFGFLLRDSRGLDLFGWDMLDGRLTPLEPFMPGEEREVAVRFRANLTAGHYFFSVTLAHWDKTKEDVRFDVQDLIVAPTPGIFTASIVNLAIQFEPRYISSVPSSLMIPLGPFTHETGLAWTCAVEDLKAVSDAPYDETRSPLVLLEDDRALGPPHSDHATIRNLGQGAYSHWQEYICLSTSDGSDPNRNGRHYFAVLPK